MDITALERRIRPPRRTAASYADIVANDSLPQDPEEMAAALVGPGGALSEIAPKFEHRVEQEQMLRAVALAFEDGNNLVVEAGTGVGKSMAYLLPAAAFALRNNTRVVVSTNTISLQEQLGGKDVETAAKTLEAAGMAGAANLRFTTLKGRANYLCLRRWSHMRTSQTLSVDEARFLGKLTTWLQDTPSGDRADLRMARPDNNVWGRLNAEGKLLCPAGEGACFLRAARERAESASVIIVNHSLLLADLARGGGLIPDYDYLVIDEAQHLEAEATSQLSTRVAHAQAAELLDELTNPRGLVMETVNAFRMTPAAQSRRQATADAAQQVTEAASRARERLDEFFPRLIRYVQDRNEGNQGQQNPLRVTSAVRAQPDWAALEVAPEQRHWRAEPVARHLGGAGAAGLPRWKSRGRTLHRLCSATAPSTASRTTTSPTTTPSVRSWPHERARSPSSAPTLTGSCTSRTPRASSGWRGRSRATWRCASRRSTWVRPFGNSSSSAGRASS